MSIRRLYSLPNCTLVLEGWNDSSAGQLETRPLMSMLANAECHLNSHKTLIGGRDFLEGLVKAVSRYSQEFLSGVHLPEDRTADLVRLDKVDDLRHRLTVQPTAVENGQGVSEPIQMDLTTVQLFDLVEAIDQLFADAQTLPNLSLNLSPISKRYVKANVPIAQRAAPAAVGIGSLAVAAIALFFVPIPEVNRPTEPTTPSTQQSSTDTPTTPPSPGASPATETNSLQPTSQATTPPSASELEQALASAPEITDPTELDILNRRLYEQVDGAWQEREAIEEELAYRVSVGRDGAILGYKPANSAAEAFDAKAVPLFDLLYQPTDDSGNFDEPIAQFKLVFTPYGVLQVSPWQGLVATPGLGPEITDSATLETLNQELYDRIIRNWTTDPTFDRQLTYRVGVTEAGEIADYEPLSQSAYDYLQETPLPDLRQSQAQDEQGPPGGVPEEPLAHYKVVFTPSGVLQVSPWRGYQ